MMTEPALLEGGESPLPYARRGRGRQGLTAAAVRNARPGDKPYKMTDAAGLHLFVSPTGAKSWRMRYRFGGKEKLLTFGLYPEVGLAESRDRRDEARKLLRAGKDPGDERARARDERAVASGNTLEIVARAWHDAERPRWSPGQAALIIRALERDVFPALGKRPVADITGQDLLVVLRRIEARGSIETAKRVLGYLRSVFKRAKAEHFVAVNPAADIGDALRRTPKGAKQPALIDPAELIGLQQSVDRSNSGPMVKLASRLIALTVVRVGVLRAVTWDELTGIDWSDPASAAPDAVWKIPAVRMKLEVAEKAEAAYDHDVPLVPQAVAVLRAMHRLTGRCRYVFPSAKSVDVPMSDAAISTLYKRRGYKDRHVPHGWRAAFSTIMNERAVEMDRDSDRMIIDIMLAHVPKGMSASEFAYNRARYKARRRELATAWADMISADLTDPQDVLMGQAR